MSLPSLQVDAPFWPHLREHMRATGYDEAGVVDRLGGIELPQPDLANLPRLLHRTRGDSRLDILLRLFLLGQPVPTPHAAVALAPLAVSDLLQAGLLCSQESDTVASAILLTPVDDLLVAADPPWLFRDGGPANAVAGVSNSTRLLADLAVRHPGASVLDFGAGQGFQSLKAATHAAQVLALDINPRALALTRLNAVLNRCEIDTQSSDGYAAASGQKFDLIVGNLPFVISPGQRFIYRDNPLGRDEFSRQILSETPALLNEGGYAHFVTSWVHLEEEDGNDRLAAIFESSACDVWIAVTDVEEPEDYAAKWIAHTQSGRTAETFREWIDYYAHEHITRISTGVITMRRRPHSPNWLRIESLPPRITAVGPLGTAVEAIFARHSLALPLTDKQLLALPLCLAPHLELTERWHRRNNLWQEPAPSLRLPEPLVRHAVVSPAALAFLNHLNGQPLRDAINAWSRQVRLSRTSAKRELLPLVREWLLLGFVTPA